jgi:hypothetical protein
MSAHVPKSPPTLATASLNRSVGFTHDERRRLGLTGRLPSRVFTLDQQAERVCVMVAGVTLVTKNMLDASAKAIAHQAGPTKPAATTHEHIVQAILVTLWVPDYPEDAR